MPMKIASDVDRAWFRVKSFADRDLPGSILTPRSLTKSISKLTTWNGRRYWGISDEL